MSDENYTKKKRINARQITKDDREEESDEDTTSEPKFDGSFERASAEELSKRKIFKLKAKTKPVQVPDQKVSAPNTNSPPAQSETQNPFAGISFNFNTPPVITSGMFSTNSSGLFANAPKLNTSTNSLVESLKPSLSNNNNNNGDNNQNTGSSLFPPLNNSNSTSSSTTGSSLFPPLNSNTNSSSTGSSLFPPLNNSSTSSTGSSLFPPLNSNSNSTNAPSSNNNNFFSLNTKTTENNNSTTSPTFSGFTFKPATENSSSLPKSTSTGSAGFVFNSTPTTNTVSSGFVFNNNIQTNSILASGNDIPEGKWKCAACETINEDKDKLCSLCMVPRLIKPANEIWKCACCETENAPTEKSCTVCMVPKPNKPISIPPKTSSSNLSSSSIFSGAKSTGADFKMNIGGSSNITFGNTTNTSSGFVFNASSNQESKPASGGFVFNASAPSTLTLGSSDSLPEGSWKCACCETVNQVNDKSCTLCMVPKPAVKTTAPASSTAPAPSSSASSLQMFSNTSNGSTGFLFNSAVSNGNESQPSNNGGGFVFNPTATTTSLFESKPLPEGVWKCACCETENQITDKSCTICMVPKPNKPISIPPKTSSSNLSSSSIFDGIKSTDTTTPSLNSGFMFNPTPTPAPSTVTKQVEQQTPKSKTLSDGRWQCGCCEKVNEAKDNTCDLCMVERS